MIAWVGGAAIGVANGVLREATYGKRIEERSANPKFPRSLRERFDDN